MKTETTKHRPWARLGSGALLALVLATGCTSSAKSFSAGADKLCAGGTKQIKALSEPTTVAEIGDQGLALGNATISLVKRLNGLDKPGGGAGKNASAFVKDLQSAGENAKKMGEAAIAGDFPAIEKAVSDTSTAYKKADTSARGLGSQQCAKNEAEIAAKVVASSPAILKNAYIAKGDEACVDALKMLEEKEFSDSLAGLTDLFTTAEASSLQALTKIRAIAPPAAEVQALTPVIGDLEALNKQYAAVRDALRAQDRTKVATLLDQTALLELKQVQSADRYGFKDCGSGNF